MAKVRPRRRLFIKKKKEWKDVGPHIPSKRRQKICSNLQVTEEGSECYTCNSAAIVPKEFHSNGAKSWNSSRFWMPKKKKEEENLLASQQQYSIIQLGIARILTIHNASCTKFKTSPAKLFECITNWDMNKCFPNYLIWTSTKKKFFFLWLLDYSIN